MHDDFNAYDLCMKIVCALSLLVALGYLVVGSVILVKLRGFYELCSRTVMQFLIVGLFFIASSLMRFISLLYKDMTGHFMEQNTFGCLNYFAPDAIIIGLINVVQILILIGQRRPKDYEKYDYEHMES